MQRFAPKTSAFAALLVSLFIAGCGGRDPRPAAFPVEGKLLVDGKPAAGALITFHGDSAENGKAYYPRATVDDGGVFRLNSFLPDDGAPPGDYVVTVYWPDPNAPKPATKDEDEGDTDLLPPDRLGLRFSSPTASKLRASVPEAPTRYAPVDLGSAEAKSGQELRFPIESGS